MDSLCSHFIDVHSLTAHLNTPFYGNSLGIQALERRRFRVQRLPLFPAMHGPVGFKIVYHYTSWFSLVIICTGIFPGVFPVASVMSTWLVTLGDRGHEAPGTRHPGELGYEHVDTALDCMAERHQLRYLRLNLNHLGMGGNLFYIAICLGE